MRFSDYLHLRIQQLGLRMADIARATGSSKGTVSLWFAGDTTPSLKFVPKLARALEIEQSALALAIEQNRAPRDASKSASVGKDFSLIPLFECYANGGSGEDYALQSAPDFMRHLYFRKDWLEYEGLEPEHLEVWMIYGRSMAPLLNEGDVILIDRSINTLEQAVPGKVYALTYKGVPLVKRLKTTEMGGYLLVSDNKSEEYPPIPVDPQSIEIAGQVVWRGGSAL